MAKRKLVVSLALVLFTASVNASPLVYVVNGSQQFGTIDLANGAFHQIGPNTPEGQSGLVPGPNGSLLTLTFSGNLDSIDPSTGVATVIGPTGLLDCTTPASPCGSHAASTLGSFGGITYATDLGNDLYAVDPFTGVATLIGYTGIPAVPFTLGATNPDGSFNAYDEALFSVGGSLYATFDAITVNPSTSAITPVIPGELYRINPLTGHATPIGPTALTLGAAVNVSGTVYAFQDASSQALALNLANGNTSFVSDFDPAAGVIDGASPTPEPGSLALTALGIAAFPVWSRRRRHQ